MAFEDRQGLMFAVGIKCGEGELGRLAGVGLDSDFAVRVADTQRSAAIGGGQRDHQSSEHPGGLFGIPVCKKEPAAVVDKHLVKLGGDCRAFATKTGGHLRKDGLEACSPGLSADLDGAWRDLPDVAHGGVDNRVLTAAVRGPSRVFYHRLDLWAGYRE